MKYLCCSTTKSPWNSPPKTTQAISPLVTKDVFFVAISSEWIAADVAQADVWKYSVLPSGERNRCEKSVKFTFGSSDGVDASKILNELFSLMPASIAERGFPMESLPGNDII